MGRRAPEPRNQDDLEPAAFRHARSDSPAAAEGSGLYRLLVETVRDYAIFALDSTGHILTWNAGAQRLKGYTADEILGKHFSIFYPAADIATGKTDYVLAVATREGRFEEDGWRVRKDGSYFWANVLITALRDPSGGLLGFAKITRDLTERKLAEEALRDSDQRFRLLVTSVKDYGIFLLDPVGRVSSWNDGAERIKGYTAREILGRHFSVFYPQEDIARGKPPWELEVASHEGRLEDEGWRLRKDGTRFWAHVVITALRNTRGELVGFAKVTRDLTERRAAQERALEDARRLAAAEAASRAKSGFLAAMSHELRTPLNAIGGYTELLQMGLRGPLTEEQQGALERIRRSQQHLLGIINDILNYTRVEAGQVAYESERVPLVEVIQAVTPMVEPQAAQKSQQIEIVPCSVDVIARADRAKVEQVLLNLLSNAVKFTPSGGRVSVGCAAVNDRVTIEVTDTGPGIPADRQEEIFEPFVQLGRTLASAHEGTGLGLAISRDLARGMGGELSVRSAEGAGATFTLELAAA